MPANQNPCDVNQVVIDRFCAIEGRHCRDCVDFRGPRSCFAAYPGSPPLLARFETLEAEARKRGISIQRWPELAGSGVIFSTICRAIHSNDILIAEATDLNANVLFEAGYALGVGRDSILLIDTNKVGSAALGILQTKYQCRYQRREEIVEHLLRYFKARDSEQVPTRAAPILDGIDFEASLDGTVYFIPAWTHDVSTDVQRRLATLKKEGHIAGWASSDPTDSLFDAFRSQAIQIAQAEAVIGLLVADNFRDSMQRNAPVAMLLGLAAGLGKEVLVLQEQPSRPLLDVGSILQQVTSEKEAVRVVRNWIEARSIKSPVESEDQLMPPSPVVNSNSNLTIQARRKARNSKRVSIRFFGSPDARLDHDLMSYFVETPDFHSAIRGERDVLVGRKGAGKSAIFSALSIDLSERPDVIPVMITPIELEYEQLSMLLERIGLRVHPNFLYPSFWRFIILTEIVQTVTQNVRWIQEPIVEAKHRSRIENTAKELEQPLSTDFATRIMQTLRSIGDSTIDTPEDRLTAHIDGIISKHRLYPLESSLIELSRELQIHLVIDDIDKRWDPKFGPSIPWVKGLLDEVMRMRSRFGEGMRSTILLRSDMLQSLMEEDTNYANRSIGYIKWDKHYLQDVIAARIEHMTDTRVNDPIDAWNAVFVAQVDQVSAPDYMIARTLMRPRDLIQFCQLSLDEALRRGAERVEEVDVLHAEGEFSEYLFNSVRTEFLLSYPGLGDALNEFYGSPPCDSRYRAQLDNIRANRDQTKGTWADTNVDIQRVLYEIGFLGICNAERGESYFEWNQTYDRAMLATKASRTFCIHPGFHGYLQIGQLTQSEIEAQQPTVAQRRSSKNANKLRASRSKKRF
jgi:hypothetical protein